MNDMKRSRRPIHLTAMIGAIVLSVIAIGMGFRMLKDAAISTDQAVAKVSEFYLKELDEFPVRTKDPYDVSAEDRETILKYLPYWEGKAMQDIARPALPTHTVECMGDDIITVGLTNGVSGETTCDHETLLTIGLKGYMEECQKHIDETMPKCQLDEEKINYWKACIIQCEGLITYAHRMADEAIRQAEQRGELLREAAACDLGGM